MKLYFHITKTGNLFHFISTFTDWHFSVRPLYKKYWLEKTGSLTADDEKWLNRAKVLFQKYSFGDNYWGKIFLCCSEDDMWQIAKEKFGKKDTKKFQQIYNHFTPRFEKIWPKEEKLLLSWKDKLQESTKEFTSIELKKDLNNLFNTHPNLNHVIKVILLMCNPTTEGAGGANVGRGAITTELSRTPLTEYKKVWLNFWHEIVHVYWERTNQYMPMLNNYLDSLEAKTPIKNVPIKVIVKEAAMGSFLSLGYLAKKHFKLPSEKIYKEKLTKLRTMHDPHKMEYWTIYSSSKLLKIAERYVQEKKPIDEKYFDEVIGILDEFKKELLTNS